MARSDRLTKNTQALSRWSAVLLVAGFLGLPCNGAPVPVPEYGMGFRGDGTGVFPGCVPPTEWDEASGKNIRWKAALPNWGYSSPVPVGNRVLFVSEPGWKSTWPELCCFDADTGSLLWKVPVDPCDAFPEMTADKRKEVTAAVEAIYAQQRAAYRICRPLEARGSVPKDDPQITEVNAQLGAHGMSIESYTQGYGLLRKLKYTDDRKKKWEQALKPYGLKPECTWQNFGAARVGIAFPTPVTDGQHVYVMTYHGTVACFALADGKRVWASHVAYKGHHGLMASPRLYDDLLLTGWIDTGNFDPRLCAFDKATGQLRWEANIKGGGAATEAQSRPGGSLVVMTVGKTPVVVCSSGRIVRLPDGKVYAASIPCSCGTYAVDDANDALFGAGHHDRGSTRWRLDLAIEGDELKITERFNVKDSWGAASSVIADGKWFVKGAMLDLLTGQPSGSTNVVTNLRKLQTAPAGNHTILVAGGHVYGLYEQTEAVKDGPKTKTGVCEVFTLNGKRVATNVLRAAKREGETATKFQEQGWPAESFSYACSMNIGDDRLYIVSDDYLYCIGAK